MCEVSWVASDHQTRVVECFVCECVDRAAILAEPRILGRVAASPVDEPTLCAAEFPRAEQEVECAVDLDVVVHPGTAGAHAFVPPDVLGSESVGRHANVDSATATSHFLDHGREVLVCGHNRHGSPRVVQRFTLSHGVLEPVVGRVAVVARTVGHEHAHLGAGLLETA